MKSSMEHLEGEWRVVRLDGLLPPLVGVRKRIRGGRDETGVASLPGGPFRIERCGEILALIYSLPLSMLVDEVRAEQGGSWLGRSVLGGLELGRFRMVCLKRQDNTIEEKRGHMIQQEKLHRKLVEYVQDVHAMEQNVSLMLESIILNTKDEGLAEMFRQHKAETRGQERRLRERLRELEGLTLASAGKDIAAIFTAQAKGIGDLLRTDKPVQNARDAFVTEHLEIAAYEILERLAERAGDAETAAVARENRTEEESMARRISDNWDKFLDLALVGEVIRP